jgi:hypothetical protein
MLMMPRDGSGLHPIYVGCPGFSKGAAFAAKGLSCDLPCVFSNLTLSEQRFGTGQGRAFAGISGDGGVGRASHGKPNGTGYD